VISAVTGGMK